MDAADLTVHSHFWIGIRQLRHIIQHIVGIRGIARVHQEIVLRCRTVIQHVFHKSLDLSRVISFQDGLRIFPNAIADGLAFRAIHHQLQGDVFRHLRCRHRHGDQIQPLGIRLVLGQVIGLCLICNGDIHHRHISNHFRQLYIEVRTNAVAQNHVPLSDLCRQNSACIGRRSGAHGDAHGSALIAQLVLTSGLDGCVHIIDAGDLIAKGISARGTLISAVSIHPQVIRDLVLCPRKVHTIIDINIDMTGHMIIGAIATKSIALIIGAAEETAGNGAALQQNNHITGKIFFVICTKDLGNRTVGHSQIDAAGYTALTTAI